MNNAAQSTGLDVVYPVREAHSNRELMYSLRSLSNVPHGKVFLAGFTPLWTRNVVPLRRSQLGKDKHVNSTQNVLLACRDRRVSNDFILMNDDFFILKPIDQIPTMHRGLVKDVLAKYKAEYGTNAYIKGMQATYDLVREHTGREPLSYELHIPMIINKEKFLKMWQIGQHIPALHKRTLYGNLFNIGGEYMEDVKITFKKRESHNDTFLSTDERSFLMLGQHRPLHKKFSQKSEYEA